MINHRNATTFFVIMSFLFSFVPLRAQVLEKVGPVETPRTKQHPIHAAEILREKELAVRKYIAEHPEAMKSSSLNKSSWSFGVGSTYSWYADDLTSTSSNPYVSRYLVPSTCRAVGTNCYIFVEDASWTAGWVTQVVVDSLRLYFDSKTPANPSKGIYQTDTEAFGNPPNVDGDPRIIILLLDIKDGYDGGGFVVGYFYSYNETVQATSNQAEIYFLDTNPLNLKTNQGLMEGISTTAHEFQHMIHFNYDQNEISFVNECCSLVAEVQCGFPIYSPQLYPYETDHYLLDWRYNDLNTVNYDYSRAARFGVYVRDQEGIGVFKNIVASTQIGVAGINAGLQSFGSSLTFDDILSNWFIANVLNDTVVNPNYGYRYPNLPKSQGYNFSNPMVPTTYDAVQPYAVDYLHFIDGSRLRVTISTANSSVVVKAVEIGASSKRVLDVPTNLEFYEPDFGTTYNEMYFVIMNTSSGTQADYSYTATGSGGSVLTTYAYAGGAIYYITLPSTNLKFATRFSPSVSGQLQSVSIAFNASAGAIVGNGNLRVGAYTNNPSGSIAGTPSTLIGSEVLVPFSQLQKGVYNEINMKSAGVFITAGTDFHVVADIVNTGDTLQFLMDSNSVSSNKRASSYRNGTLGWGWYNRADPNYGGGKLPSYENFLMAATVAVPILVVEPPANLTATAITSTEIDLNWSDMSSNENGFSIERKTEIFGTYNEIAVVGSNVTSYQDKSIATNITYYYRLRAFSGSTYSDYSNEVSAVADYGPFIYHDTTTVSPITIINNTTLPAPLNIYASAAENHSPIAQLQLQYRQTGQTSWSTVEYSNFSTTESRTIPAGTFVIAGIGVGVEYRLYARDQLNNESYTNLYFVKVQNGPGVGIKSTITLPAASTYSSSESYKAYRIFSVPYDLNNRQPLFIESSLGPHKQDATPYYHWRMQRVLNGMQDYEDYKANQVVAPGNGFFLITRESGKSIILNQANSIVRPDQMNSEGIQLANGMNGWYILGCPLGIPIPWNRIVFSGATVLDHAIFTGAGTIYGWDKSTRADTLRPWEGIAVKTTGPCTVKFNVAGGFSKTVTQEPTPMLDIKNNHSSAADVDNWTITINARRTDMDVQCYGSGFGMHTGASEGPDQFDSYLPPFLGDHIVAVGFSGSEDGIMRDIRPMNSEGSTWNMHVITGDAGAKVKLQFEGISHLPNPAFEVYVFDLDQKMAYNLKELQSFEINSGNGRRNFRVAAGKQSYIEQNNDGIAIKPSEMKLFSNYPNPFNPETVIRYTVPNTSSLYKVTLKIYNILGQEIATLVDGQKNSGYYEVTWNAMQKSSGIYFYRLTLTDGTRKFSNVKKMILLK